MLALCPRLKIAHLLKEKFLEFIDAKDFEEAKIILHQWYLLTNAACLPQAGRLTRVQLLSDDHL